MLISAGGAQGARRRPQGGGTGQPFRKTYRKTRTNRRHGFTPSASGLSRAGFLAGLAFRQKHPGGKLHASPYRVCHAFCMPFSCSLPSVVRSARGTPAPVGSVMPLACLLPCPGCFWSCVSHATPRRQTARQPLSGLSCILHALFLLPPFAPCFAPTRGPSAHYRARFGSPTDAIATVGSPHVWAHSGVSAASLGRSLSKGHASPCRVCHAPCRPVTLPGVFLVLRFTRNPPAANCTPAPIGSVMQFACPFLAPSLRSLLRAYSWGQCALSRAVRDADRCYRTRRRPERLAPLVGLRGVARSYAQQGSRQTLSGLSCPLQGRYLARGVACETLRPAKKPMPCFARHPCLRSVRAVPGFLFVFPANTPALRAAAGPLRTACAYKHITIYLS